MASHFLTRVQSVAKTHSATVTLGLHSLTQKQNMEIQGVCPPFLPILGSVEGRAHKRSHQGWILDSWDWGSFLLKQDLNGLSGLWLMYMMALC